MLTDERGKVPAMKEYKLGLLLDAVAQLQKIGRTLHTRYENNCNGPIDVDDQDAEGNDIVIDQLQKKADEIGANVGLYVYHQTDCRGWPIYVSYSPIPDNDYNRAAIAIDCRSDEDKDEDED